MSDIASSNNGLMSRIAKFVTNPTTHWSDLDKSENSASSAESRMALREMMERKRRNDIIRNKEFDALRKIRQKKDPALAIDPISQSFDNSEPAKIERGKLVNKIGILEEEIARSWTKHGKEGPSTKPRTTPIPPAPARPPIQAQQAQAPQQKPHSSAAMLQARQQAEAVKQQRAFAPTNIQSPSPQAQRQAPIRPPVAAAPVQASAPIQTPVRAPIQQAPVASPVAPQPAPARPATARFGDMADFNVEVTVEVRQDPEVEGAAILFANGDDVGAEQALLALLTEGGSHRENLDTWLTLFDFYRASVQQAKFDDKASFFAAKFGRSAPQWARITERVTSPAPLLGLKTAATANSATGNAALFNWVAPSALGIPTITAMKSALSRNAPPWKIDWRNIKTIDEAALPALVVELTNWANTKTKFKFLGIEHLLKILTDKSPAEDKSANQLWWQARLALLRVLGEMDEFEILALSYCLTYEISPPAWEKPLNEYALANEEGETVLPSTFGTEDSPSTMPYMPTEPPQDGLAMPKESNLVLEGILAGTAQDELKTIDTKSKTNNIEINCRALQRVDFGAAGDLLNWAMAHKSENRPVTFKQVNRMVAAFFGVVGINDAAKVMLRTD